MRILQRDTGGTRGLAESVKLCDELCELFLRHGHTSVTKVPKKPYIDDPVRIAKTLPQLPRDTEIFRLVKDVLYVVVVRPLSAGVLTAWLAESDDIIDPNSDGELGNGSDEDIDDSIHHLRLHTGAGGHAKWAYVVNIVLPTPDLDDEMRFVLREEGYVTERRIYIERRCLRSRRCGSHLDRHIDKRVV